MPAGRMTLFKPSAKRSVDKKQNKEIKVLKRQVRILNKEQELKFLDNTIFSVIPSEAGVGSYQYDLCAMNAWDSGAAGANALRNSEREGNKIVVKRASIKGTIYLAQDQGVVLDPTYDTKVRMLIVLSPDSGYPLLTQVLETPTDIFSHNKIKPENPYKILYDRTFDLQCAEQEQKIKSTNNVAPVENWRLNFNIKLGKKAFGKDGLTCTWQQGSTSIHPQQGAVTVFVMSTAPDANFKPQIDARTRVRFIDN